MPLPPATKLPLAVRKNLRDDFEANKETFEKEISDLLGTEWKIDINPLAIYPYGTDSFSKDCLGSCLKSYMEGVTWRLKYWLEKEANEAKDEINTVCFAHTITFGVDESGKFTYGGVVVDDGSLKIVFKEGNLGVNVNDTLETLSAALNDAPVKDGSPLSVQSRLSIARDYNPKVEEWTKKFSDMLGVPITLNPNFEENFAVCKARSRGKKSELRDDWETIIGEMTLKYWEGAHWVMNYKKFGDDDMLQEAFTDEISKNQIEFRVAEKLKKGSGYNECFHEDGVLILQTTPENFGTNVDQACEGIVDIF
ncbi:hypothetical protein BT63DRAFT_419512 [Microthyrium microscopicum]|uniref:Uncharacterized protein n=1 Tax=Microthyrium microscopicum TaxID=703497 RepID=A0A6A6UR32_9PEZI|nr:hypothetical protein BT63DRAFT_419512 [Microthyrium microscopicum]